MKENSKTSGADTVMSPRAWSRRQFVAGTAATASLTLLKPRFVAGSEANSKVEVGIVGLGGRGSLIARLIHERHPGYRIVAVADYFPEVAERVGKELEVPPARQFSGLHGYRRLLDLSLDAIFLETPPCFFPEHAGAAVRAGCHVYMAKPVACDVAGCLEIQELGRLARRRDRVFLVDFQIPTNPFNRETVERCRQGLLGSVGLLSSFYTDEGFPDPPLTPTIESRLQNLVWVNDINLGGGFLVNAGIHALDAALWIAGNHPSAAIGSSRILRSQPHGDSRDIYSLTYEFEDGLILNHRGEHLKNLHGFQCQCTAYGQEGHAVVTYDGPSWLRGNRGGYRGGEVTNLYVDGIHHNLEKFHRHVVQGEVTNETVDPSVRSTLAAILGREAASRNTRLTWENLIQENQRLPVELAGLRT